MDTQHDCQTPGMCDKCLKGGLPIPKELTSFFALLFLTLSLILGILLLNAQRTLVRQSKSVAVSATPAPVVKAIKLPVPRTYTTTIALPAPVTKSVYSVEQALQSRRSRRTFAATPLKLHDLSQILWAAQGVTDPKNGLRTAPSAYNVYPFTLYVVVRDVAGLAPGLYEYLPATHALGDMKMADAGTVLNSAGIEAGAQKTPVVLLLSAALDKGVEKLKGSAVSSAYLEGGHIGENIYLEVESLKLSTVVMGGVGTAAQALKLDPSETIVYVIPVGNRSTEVTQ